MTDINQAILAAFVSVRGERPKEPVINAPEIVHSNWRYVVRDWDADLADFRKMLKALERAGRKSCEWRQQDDWDNSANWDTSCGNIFTLMEGNPTENGMKFCCYCGKELIHVTND